MEDGLIFHSCPLGILEIHSKGDAITLIKFLDEVAADKEEKNSKVIQQCIQELDAYFNGNLHHFSVKLLPEGTPFQQKVWQALQKIEYGKTTSYSALAIELGDIKAIRAVGTSNGKNKIPIIIPCHRVIGKDGSLTGFAGGLARKEWLLKHEGAITNHQLDLFAG